MSNQSYKPVVTIVVLLACILLITSCAANLEEQMHRLSQKVEDESQDSVQITTTATADTVTPPYPPRDVLKFDQKPEQWNLFIGERINIAEFTPDYSFQTNKNSAVEVMMRKSTNIREMKTYYLQEISEGECIVIIRIKPLKK
jgi:hypothetical protein